MQVGAKSCRLGRLGGWKGEGAVADAVSLCWQIKWTGVTAGWGAT